MLDLSNVPPAELRTAQAVEAHLKDEWRYQMNSTCVRVPKSALLEDIANTAVNPVEIGSSRLFRRQMRLSGDPLVLQGIFKVYLAMVLGSDRIA
jgi:hypothetical protein